MTDWFVKLASITVLVLAAVFAYGKMGPGIPISSVVTQKQDFFTVSGEGKVTVVPDTAIVDLGIVTNSNQVKTAQSQANTVVTNISGELQKLGVDKKDIKTSNYSVYPQYDYQPGDPGRITGYQVNANLTITIREIDKVNQVIDTATAQGANTVGGIQLTVAEDKQKELMQEARELAVAEAKTKAESLAKAAGITLGRIINVQENGGVGIPVPMYAKELSVDGRGGGGTATDIQPGSTDISTSVTLYYETR